MKVILDNNIWISFLIGKKLSLLKTLFSNPSITIYVCNELIEEFRDVSQRSKIKKYISEQDVWDTFKIMEGFCQFVKIDKDSSALIRDAKDLYLLSLAEAVQADYIVTGDKDLLVLKNHENTETVI